MSMVFRKVVEENGIPPERYAEAARDFVRLECSDDRTKQADKESCDINAIVRRNLETGILPQSKVMPIFGDVSELGSLQDALDTVTRAGEFFMGLSSPVREAFGNDPLRFVRESEDPAMVWKFQKFGLVPKKEAAPAAAGTAPSTVAT